jgi:peptide/nickel transport system substrate-binding protein
MGSKLRTGFKGAAVLFVLMGLWACGGGNGKDKDKITVRLPGTLVQSLSPVAWSPQVPYMQGTLFEGLYGYDRQLNVIPKLAETTLVSEDKKSWVFKLRHDAKWSNGDPLSANDFIFAWTRFCSADEPIAPMWASFFPYVEGVEGFKAGLGRQEELGFRALDEYTIEVRLRKAKDIRPLLVLPSAMPLNRKTIEKFGKDWWRPGKFVGNGPYIPVEFQADDKLVIEKSPQYVGEVGNVDRFEIKAGGLLVQLQNYEAGALDVAHILSLGDYRYVLKNEELHEQMREELELGYNGYQIARTVNPLVHKPEIRRALALAIDKKRIAEAVMGDRVLATDVFGPPADTLLQHLEGIPYDPALARQLLKDVGYKGEEITMFATPSNDYRGWGPVAEALQAMWKEVGFNVAIQPYEDGILNQYAWGTGYYEGDEFKRPGMTMYTGKMLWKDPTMMLRLADHTWIFHNLPYETQVKLKALAIEARNFANLGLGEQEADWKPLDELSDRLSVERSRVLAEEKDPNLREDLSLPDYPAQYRRVREAFRINAPKEEKLKSWLLARTTLFEGEDKMMRYTGNRENLPYLRLLSSLERSSEQEAAPVLKTVQQEALKEAWIVPLYSEKLVYLARPWIKGEVLNKYGGWLCLFNLQYMNVDKEAYSSSR